MNYRCLTFAIALLAAPSAQVESKEPASHYSIKLNDKLIGYSTFRSGSILQEGRQLLQMTSQTSLKIALLGKVRHTMLDSVTLADAKTGDPVSYRMTNTINEVIQHVETEFHGTTARTWSYREGDPRGDPVETELQPGTVILGSNNFSHWQQLLDAARSRADQGRATIPVFLPDSPQTTHFDLVRSDQRKLHGERNCVVWILEKQRIDILVDAETHSLVLMDLRSQKSTIEQADKSVVKLAQKSQAEEVLAKRFKQSNEVFDDFLKVRRMKASIDVTVIGSGVENGISTLTTSMQQFSGTKTERIRGEVTIQSVSYEVDTSLAFPNTEQPEELAKWLEPSTFVESDHPLIVAQANKLTKDAKNRWNAVLQIGDWVHQEIAYTIADTPSARLALEKRKGDCGPHSTLMIAMLRASGIPARLVGGLAYTPTLGGSFGQHAWVEVHMGKSGWLAVDPTTGEFQQLNATHIKLFDGLGGVVPESVHVESFAPVNRREAVVMPPVNAKPLTWELEKEHTFTFTKAGKEIGKETVTITKLEHEGEAAFQLVSEIKLKVSLFSSLQSRTTLIVAPNARPLAMERELSASLTKVKIECEFEEGLVKEKVSGSQNLSRDVKLPKGVFCFDNNLMACWVMIASQMSLEPEKAVQIRTFHPSSLQILPLTITPKPLAKLALGDSEVACYECEIAPINNTFWISKEGKFLRAKQGELVIELTTSN